MSGEIYQAQVVKNFFDTITGSDRNITRIYMCVISVAKLRNEPPEKLTLLIDQLKKSRQQHELSIDLLDYMCDVADALDQPVVQAAFGVRDLSLTAHEFSSISLDSL